MTRGTSECGRGLRAVRTVADRLAWSGGQDGRTVFAIFGIRPENAEAPAGVREIFPECT